MNRVTQVRDKKLLSLKVTFKYYDVIISPAYVFMGGYRQSGT